MPNSALRRISLAALALLAVTGVAIAGTPAVGQPAPAFKLQDQDGKWRTLGISVDDVESHKKFAEKHGLPFTLLADADKAVAKQYGVLRSFGAVEVARRDTFLIDPQGRIARHYESVDPDTNSKVVLEDIKALKVTSGG